MSSVNFSLRYKTTADRYISTRGKFSETAQFACNAALPEMHVNVSSSVVRVPSLNVL